MKTLGSICWASVQMCACACSILKYVINFAHTHTHTHTHTHMRAYMHTYTHLSTQCQPWTKISSHWEPPATFPYVKEHCQFFFSPLTFNRKPPWTMVWVNLLILWMMLPWKELSKKSVKQLGLINTAKLNQPRPKMAVSMDWDMACKKAVNNFRGHSSIMIQQSSQFTNN